MACLVISGSGTFIRLPRQDLGLTVLTQKCRDLFALASLEEHALFLQRHSNSEIKRGLTSIASRHPAMIREASVPASSRSSLTDDVYASEG
jgi:hypothetical protein